MFSVIFDSLRNAAKDYCEALFERYYLADGQDIERALQLYRWNTRLAGAFSNVDPADQSRVSTRTARKAAISRIVIPETARAP